MAEEPKAPALFFYVKDYSSDTDVRNFTAEQRGWYTQLLWDAWDNNPQGFLYNNDDKLQASAKARIPQVPAPLLSITHVSELFAQALVEAGKYEDLQSALGSTEVQRSFNAYFKKMEERRDEAQLVLNVEFAKQWKEVKAKFRKHGDFIYHKRLLEEKVKQIDNRASRRKAAMEGVNAKRAKRGLPPLEVEPGLDVGITEVERMLAGVPTEVAPDVNQRLTSSIAIAIPEKEQKESTNVDEKKRGSRMTLTWEPKDEDEWKTVFDLCKTVCTLVDPREELPAFRDHWIGVPGKAGLKVDWLGTFRNRLRSQQKYYAERAQRNGKSSLTPSEELSAEDAALELEQDQLIITRLQAMSKYQHLDVQNIYTAMNAHCAKTGNTATESLLVDWLDNNIDLQPRSNGTPLFDAALSASDDNLSEFKDG